MSAAVAELARREVPEATDIVAAVRAILSVPDDELDYARAKLAFDGLVDPSLEPDETMAEIDRLAARAAAMAGPDAPEGARLGAIRRLIYDEGPWNEFRPYQYNLARTDGNHVSDQLLDIYLRTRLGNCVSMPILMVVLAERLGVGLALATAPRHIFVRYTAPDGTAFNIEATSGGHPSRIEWFRQNFLITDRAIESGLHMRTLPKREGITLMGATLIEHLVNERRYEKAIGVADAILAHKPRDEQALLWQGTAYGWLIQTEFAAKYPMPFLIPEPARSRYRLLCIRNEALFARAEALGWEPEPGDGGTGG